MKTSLLIVFAVINVISLSAQTESIDSLKNELEITRNDTMQYALLDALSRNYLETKPDSALYYARRAMETARGLQFKLGQAVSLGKIGYAQQNLANYPASLKAYLSGIEIANDPKSANRILSSKYFPLLALNPELTGSGFRIATLGFLHEFTGILYENANDYERELYHLRFARQYAEQNKDTAHLSELYYILGRVYLSMQKNDSAFIYEQKAYQYSVQSGASPAGPLLTLGKYYMAIGNDQQAVEYLRRASSESHATRYFRGVIASNLLLSAIARKRRDMDSSLYFANSALLLAQQMNAPDLLLRAWSEQVAFYSSSKRIDSVAKYQALIIQLKDSLFNSKQLQEFRNVDFDEQQRQQEVENVRKALKNRIQTYGLLAGLFVFLLIAAILWRNNRHKQKAYALLKAQKRETDFQKSKVEQTLDELRSTQSQLIQSEKMASLGELTAGIAHEIQNPLNFVNNFSEVNNELIEELKNELATGNAQSANEIMNNLKENGEKINHHGKRADAIVKSMLQHSRVSSGQKELTDINALVEEHLRLAYHGIRAKDKNFRAEMKTEFDNSIGKINVVPQDIGRVLLNLINNAFYAVSERQRAEGERYEPTVKVRTAKENRVVEIGVTDNGNGIQQKVLDKIFQPFFTTKPTGEGTGLGLSLAYDIIKAHGGEIRVETKEGEGSEFIIQLPLSKTSEP